MITRNVGKMDRGARILLGLAMIAGYFAVSNEPHGWLYLLGGALALVTGAMGHCGLYSLMGMSTCKAK